MKFPLQERQYPVSGNTPQPDQFSLQYVFYLVFSNKETLKPVFTVHVPVIFIRFV